MAHLADLSTLDNKVSLIWAVMQCHTFWNDFIAVDFRGHPTIVKEISLFMLSERVDPKELESFIGAAGKASLKFKGSRKDYDSLHDKHHVLAKTVKTLEGVVRNLKEVGIPMSRLS